MLMEKRGKEAYNLLRFQTKQRSPDGAVRAASALADALNPPVWGKSYPWEEWTELTYGQRDGELISIGGGVGCGKTTIAHEIAAWNIREHKENVACILLEETNGNTLKNIAAKIAGVPFHRPDVPFQRDVFMDVYERLLKEQLYLWRNKGQNDWDNIVQAIRYWAVAFGVKSMFVDNMTALVNHLSPTEQNTEIAKIATQSAGLADELGIRIYMFSHLNPPKGGKTHEEGAEVKEAQFTGGRGLSRWSQGMWGFERNKQAEGDEKHNSILRYIKDRNYGNTGLIHTRYDPDTTRLLVRQGDEARLAESDDDEPFP
jgi:twinkle protein